MSPVYLMVEEYLTYLNQKIFMNRKMKMVNYV